MIETLVSEIKELLEKINNEEINKLSYEILLNDNTTINHIKRLKNILIIEKNKLWYKLLEKENGK